MIGKKSVVIYIAVLIAVFAAVLAGAYRFFFRGVERDDAVRSMVNSQTDTEPEQLDPFDCVALFGIDAAEGEQGRSDAIMLASIDSQNNRIRLCSIARDTRVDIEGYGQRKLNAAYSYGGGDLALRTINSNFGLHVTSYIAVNFSGMADIVDQLGGVEISLSEAEISYLRKHLTAEQRSSLESGERVLLNGKQAVAYSRIRYLDNDDVRTSRQREVLESLLERVRGMDSAQYPQLLDQLMAQCTSNLSQAQMLALLAQLTPEKTDIRQHAVPSENREQAEGRKIDGAWYYVYDTQEAGREIRDFLGIE
ncbi:MAG TPA: LytR family transcriptional regulator [Clostridiales bacterium]|nr:LytR family transcriptional regulator [Clostridiales bacterium]